MMASPLLLVATALAPPRLCRGRACAWMAHAITRAMQIVAAHDMVAVGGRGLVSVSPATTHVDG